MCGILKWNYLVVKMASSVAVVCTNNHGSFNPSLFPNFCILNTQHALVLVRNSA